MPLKLITAKRCGLWASGGDWSDPGIWRDNHGNKVGRIPTYSDHVYITGNVSGIGEAASVTVGTEEELKALVLGTLKYPPPEGSPWWAQPTTKTFLAADPECCCDCKCPSSCEFQCYAPVPGLEVTMDGDDCSEGRGCYYSTYLGYHVWYYYPEFNYGEEPTPCLPCKFDPSDQESQPHGSGMSVSMHCASGPKWIVEVETSCDEYGSWTLNPGGDQYNFPGDYTYVAGVGSCRIRYRGEIGASGCVFETGPVELEEVFRESIPDPGNEGGDPCGELNPSKPDITVL